MLSKLGIRTIKLVSSSYLIPSVFRLYRKSLFNSFICSNYYNSSFSSVFEHNLTNLTRLTMSNQNKSIKFLTQAEANQMDNSFFTTCHYSLDQLMELAGRSVADVLALEFPVHTHPKVLIISGPGNNGGDGLVAARVLQGQYGYDCTLIYPKPGKGEFLNKLIKQLEVHSIKVESQLPQDLSQYNVCVDAIFGHNFKPPIRGVFKDIINNLNQSKIPILSVDVPSGWNVDKGIKEEGGINTKVLISLACPKIVAKTFPGTHYLGGRFVPPSLQKEFTMNLPPFPNPVSVLNISDLK